MNKTTIIHNGIVVTRNSDNAVIHNGAVAFCGSKITAVGSSPDLLKLYPDADKTDAHGGLIMPGYINTHAHSYCSLTRGVGIPNFIPKDFMDNLVNKWWKLDSMFDYDQCISMAEAAYLDAIKAGVTTEFDHHASFGNISNSLDALSYAAEKNGLRTCICYETSDRAGLEKAKEAVDENVRYMKSVASSKLQRGYMGLHASFTLSDSTFDYIADKMEGMDGYHIHVAECFSDQEDSLNKYNMRIVNRLEHLGILGARTILAHCVYLSDEEISLIESTGTAVVNNPESNMNNAVDCPPSIKLVNKGVLTGIGMDGFTHDMISAWRIAGALFRFNDKSLNSGWTELPQMIFKNNGIIAGNCFGETIGVLEPEAAADIIVVNYNAPTPVTKDSIDSHLLFGTSGKDTETVICNGKILMKDRIVIGIDEERVYADARARAERLIKLL